MRKPTKGNRARSVALPTTVHRHLLAYIAHHGLGLGDLLWPAVGGGPAWSSVLIHDAWQPAARAAVAAAEAGGPSSGLWPLRALTGDPVDRAPGRRRAPTPHDARATMASLLRQAGAMESDVRAQLGHTAQEITDLYQEVAMWGTEVAELVALRRPGLRFDEVLDGIYTACWQGYDAWGLAARGGRDALPDW